MKDMVTMPLWQYILSIVTASVVALISHDIATWLMSGV